MLELFPLEEIRPSQRKVLEEIHAAIKQGYKQIVLEASTGFGKSPVAVAVARYFKTAYFVTSTINLQDQYLRDFPYMRKVVGKNNYECRVLQERNAAGMFRCEEDETTNYDECGHVTVDSAPCIDKGFVCPYATTRFDYDKDLPELDLKEDIRMLRKDPAKAEILYPTSRKVTNFVTWDHYKKFGNNYNPCTYYHDKNIGLLSPFTIFNYAIFNKMNAVKHRVGKPYLDTKGILILDEGHLFEQEVISGNGEELTLKLIMELTRNRIVQMPEELTLEQWVEFLRNVLGLATANAENLRAERQEIFDLVNKKQVNQKQLKRFYSLLRIIKYVEEKIEKIEGLTQDIVSSPQNWIVDRTGNKVVFKPLDITKYCQELYEYGDYLLVMSATILDKDMYCRQIGLDPNEVKFISVDSDFPVENRPIFLDYVAKLNKDNVDRPQTHRAIASKLNEIMKRYSNQRGIIHMPTSKMIEQILPYMDKEQKRRLYIVKAMSSRDRTEMLQMFESTPRGVLISPSLYVGIDLKDDLSRFQVIVKVPYSSLGDKWIKAKYDQNKAWYTWTTLLKVIQGYGRSIRSTEDFADTYILDENFENIMRFSSKLLPDSFKQAVWYGKRNPTAQIGNKVRVTQK